MSQESLTLSFSPSFQYYQCTIKEGQLLSSLVQRNGECVQFIILSSQKWFLFFLFQRGCVDGDGHPTPNLDSRQIRTFGGGIFCSQVAPVLSSDLFHREGFNPAWDKERQALPMRIDKCQLKPLYNKEKGGIREQQVQVPCLQSRYLLQIITSQHDVIHIHNETVILVPMPLMNIVW